MEPISLSLLAISACSVALRRIDAAARAERLSAEERAPEQGPRALVMHAVSQMEIERTGRSGTSTPLRDLLASIAPRHDVSVILNTPFNDFIEVSGQNKDLLEKAMESRSIDALICNMDGLPLCGLALPKNAEADAPDPIRARLFRDVGLPLVVLPEDCMWHDARAHLDKAWAEKDQRLLEGAADTDIAAMDRQARSA